MSFCKARTGILGLLIAAASAAVLTSLACGTAGAITLAPAPTSAHWVTFQDGSFTVDMPDWVEHSVEDETTLKIIAHDGWVLSVSRHEGIPRLLGRYIANALPGNGPYVDIRVEDSRADSTRITARIDEQPPTLLSIDLIYCDGATYQLTGSAPEAEASEFLATFDEMRARAFCAAQPHAALSSLGLIGLIITPSDEDFSHANYRADILEARQAGIQAAHIYLSWGQIESADGTMDWTFSDILLDTLSLEGMRLSLVLEFIHSSVPGLVPEDLAGLSFDDPDYMDRAADFAVSVAQRYGDQIDYLALGNEVNIYLQSNPDDLAPYLQAFSTLRQAVRIVRPDLPIGTVIAFHEIMASDGWDLLEAFKLGDFLAYTYYPHEPGFSYDIATDGFTSVLERMISASGDKPFLVVENGFSSSSSLGSDEERQAQYIHDTFTALRTYRQEFNWHVWFSFHDSTPETCAVLARSFFPPNLDPGNVDSTTWEAFETYLCNLGLRQIDGTPKQAWRALTQELVAYQGR